MKDLVWTKPPEGTPADGPDLTGFFDVARYSANVHFGGVSQWTRVEVLLDTNHRPPLFWRRTMVGLETAWAVAKVPTTRRLYNRCVDHPGVPLVDRKDGDMGCSTCGKPVRVETVRE